MAKPKQSVIVKTRNGNGIDVWVDRPAKAIEAILKVEGVSLALIPNGSNIFIWIDPRYDEEEIADEIRILLSSEVPSVFMDVFME